jgi:hypothetical protein
MIHKTYFYILLSHDMVRLIIALLKILFLPLELRGGLIILVALLRGIKITDVINVGDHLTWETAYPGLPGGPNVIICVQRLKREVENVCQSDKAQERLSQPLLALKMELGHEQRIVGGL